MTLLPTRMQTDKVIPKCLPFYAGDTIKFQQNCFKPLTKLYEFPFIFHMYIAPGWGHMTCPTISIFMLKGSSCPLYSLKESKQRLQTLIKHDFLLIYLMRSGDSVCSGVSKNISIIGLIHWQLKLVQSQLCLSCSVNILKFK